MELTKKNSVEWIWEQVEQIPEYPKDKYQDRGIVMIAGGNKYWVNAYASIRLLREKGCKMPIICYYLGDKEKDDGMQEILKRYDVDCIDIRVYNKTLATPHKNLNGWEAKPFAVIHCPWQEVLYLDADVFCKSDPEWMFDSEQYNKYGCIMMPDRGRLAPNRDIWKLCGVDYRDEMEVESGIIFIDKERHWEPLNLCNKMCEVGTKFDWFGGHGDKETWHMAWRILGIEYFQRQKSWDNIAGTMIQCDTNGEHFFFHRNMRKLDLLNNQPVGIKFANEDLIFGYLEELKTEWNPYALLGQDENTNELAGTSYMYIRLGIDQRILTFGKDNKIITGKAKMENSYSLKDGKLYLLNTDGGITASFEKWEGGWIGRWLDYERCITLLIAK
jgi:hypothetical protein